MFVFIYSGCAFLVSFQAKCSNNWNVALFFVKIFFQPLSRLGAKVLGIDMVAESIDVAINHSLKTTQAAGPFGVPEYRKSCTREIADRFPGEFDVAIASEVLEHVADWEQVVGDMAVCLKVIDFGN